MDVTLVCVLTFAAAAVGQWGYGGCPTCGNTAYGAAAVVPFGYPAAPTAAAAVPAAPATVPMAAVAPGAGLTYGSGSGSEQLYPYDSPAPWMHGYIQHVPAYGGFRYFRPYNYKHALAQSTTAGQWGISPAMPYSQQFWHRYEDRASLNPPPGSSTSQADLAAQYARELARLKAWYDFQASLAAQQPAYSPRGSASAYPTQPTGTTNPAGYWPAQSASGSQPAWTAGGPANAWPAGATAPGYGTVRTGASPRGPFAPPAAGPAPPPPAPATAAPATVPVPPAAQVQQLERQLQQQAEQLRRLESLLQQRAAQAGAWPPSSARSSPTLTGAASSGATSTGWNGGSRWTPPPRAY